MHRSLAFFVVVVVFKSTEVIKKKNKSKVDRLILLRTV